MKNCTLLVILFAISLIFAAPEHLADSLLAEMPDITADSSAYNAWKIDYASALRGGRIPRERPAEPMDWRVENGYVAATVDETTGEFEQGASPAGTGAYRKLTYSWPGAPGTGYIIYYVDGNTGKTDATLPNTSSNYMVDNTAYSIWENWHGVYIRQEITTVSLGGDPGENEQVKFKTVMKSADSDCHEVGCLVFYDTMLDDDDAAEISTAYGYTGRAEIFFGEDVPGIWRAYQDGYPPRPGALTALGILIGFEAVTPDVFWYGSWPLGSGNGWDDSDWISASGGTFRDSATMVKWYPRNVCPGDSVVYVTYYGIGEITAGLDLSISAGTPPFSTGCTGISPNPFVLDAVITNPGATDVTDVEVELTLPPGLSIVAGDNPRFLGGLTGYGGSRLLSWTIDIDPSAFGASACYDIEVNWGEGGPVFRTYCPFIPALNTVSVDIDAEFESLCRGDCTQLRAVIDTASASGREWSYIWRPSGALSDSTGTTVYACPESTTTFWAIVSDGADCIDSTGRTIVVNDDPIVELRDTTICLGESVTISPTVSPDVPGNIFVWFPGGETTREITVSPETTTTYDVLVISPDGCHSSDMGQVIVEICAIPWSVLLDPFVGAWSSCEDQDIRLVVQDDGEVDTMSIRFTVDGRAYSIGDSELAIEDDSILVFTPSSNWPDGHTVRFSLDSLSNDAGIIADSLPSGLFHIDLSPPVPVSFEPPEGAVLHTPHPIIKFAITDFLTGIDADLVSVTIGTATFPITASGIDYAFYGDTLECEINSIALGIDFFQSDTVFVAVESGDSPDYCPPNMAVFSWRFLLDLASSCIQFPNPITPNDDGINDVAVFEYPQMFIGPAELTIFDLRNTLVFRADIGPAGDFGDVENRLWDATDLNGNPVREGLYIYMIQMDGRILCNGTITVIR
ncbi:MAG TPA: hypothetical protein ENN07_02690 [candidate division Zixibacteria bacterium]|nr:hypothetical protein [candidate division Zixibacteria bacterium]